MGDRSPKDKMKKQKQHEKDHAKQAQQKQDNMIKNRRETGKPGEEDQQQQFKKVG